MKTLVVYYSRTGNTRQVGEVIAHALRADVEWLDDRRDRRGWRGWLRAAVEARLHRAVPLVSLAHDPTGYDLVIVGTPVWTGTVSSPVRSFLEQYGRRLPRVAFFVTYGGTVKQSAFAAMESMAAKPIGTLAILESEVLSDRYIEPARRFAEQLRAAMRGKGVPASFDAGAHAPL